MRLHFAAATLLVLAACGRPQAAPWPDQVHKAIARDHAAEGRDFEAGFRNGAEMVHAALKAGLRPFRPVLDRSAADLDPATGLLTVSVAGPAGDAFARGQVRGFDWALGAVGQTLVQPPPRPAFPADWSRWGDRVADGARSATLCWAPGLVGWAVAEAGFPPRRAWRPWSEPEAPVWAALSGRVLWVETRAGQALAIDLETGGILEARPAASHEAQVRFDLDRQRAAAEREFRSPAFQAEIAALRARAATGGIPAILAVARRLGGMGEPAEAEAYAWFLKAAELGDPVAMLNVGVRLHHGTGTPADPAASARWLDRAAQAGLPEASAIRTMLAPEPPAAAAGPGPQGPGAGSPPR